MAREATVVAMAVVRRGGVIGRRRGTVGMAVAVGHTLARVVAVAEAVVMMEFSGHNHRTVSRTLSDFVTITTHSDNRRS